MERDKSNSDPRYTPSSFKELGEKFAGRSVWMRVGEIPVRVQWNEDGSQFSHDGLKGGEWVSDWPDRALVLENAEEIEEAIARTMARQNKET